MSQFAVNILWVSLICTVLIFCLWFFSDMLNKRYAAKWKYWVWLIMAIRLIVPMNFILPQMQTSPIVPEIITISDISMAELFLPQTLPAQNIQVQEENAALVPMSGITLYETLFFIWLAGSLMFIIIQSVRYFVSKRGILRWSHEAERADIYECIKKLSGEMGIEKSITPLINNEIAGPMIMGLARPVLMLTHEDYQACDLAFILRHELTHYRNRDIIYKIVLFIANAIHWFNPAVYLLVREAHADLERVCDDEVTKNCTDEERRAYSEVILSSISLRKTHGNMLTTSFYTGTKNIKARFRNIMTGKKGKKGYAGLFALAFTVGIISGFAAPVIGYATQQNAAELLPCPTTGQTRSYTFTAMSVDMEYIDNLEINLLHGDLLFLVNDWLVTGSQVHFSGMTLFNTLSINPATSTAYIYNAANPLFLPDETEEDTVLVIVVSGESDWAFEQANIHLEHGSIRYIGTHTHNIEDFLAKNLNISLPHGSIEHDVIEETFTPH